MQTLKRSVAVVVLTDVEFELRSGRLAIQGQVQAGHSFEAYCLAKWLAAQQSGWQFVRLVPFFLSQGIHLEGVEAKAKEVVPS